MTLLRTQSNLSLISFSPNFSLDCSPLFKQSNAETKRRTRSGMHLPLSFQATAQSDCPVHLVISGHPSSHHLFSFALSTHLRSLSFSSFPSLLFFLFFLFFFFYSSPDMLGSHLPITFQTHRFITYHCCNHLLFFFVKKNKVLPLN